MRSHFGGGGEQQMISSKAMSKDSEFEMRRVTIFGITPMSKPVIETAVTITNQQQIFKKQGMVEVV